MLSFVTKNYDGIIPDGGDEGGPLSPNDEHDADFISEVNALLQQYIESLESVKLRQGLHTVMQLSSRGNLYLQAAGLSNALKESDPKRCAQVLSRAVNLIYLLSVLIEPFMPSTAAAILTQLNAPVRTVPELFSADILAGHHIGKVTLLFKPIKEEMAEIWRERFGGNKKTTSAQVGDLKADSAHVTAPQVSKRKAAAAAKAAKKEHPIYTGLKTPEISALEEKIAAQGDVVRKLKAAAPKTKELDAEIAAAVDVLKGLKAELASVINALQ